MKIVLRKIISVLLLAIVFGNAVPKNYFHAETDHPHSFALSEHHHQKGKTEMHNSNMCNFSEYDVYTPFVFVSESLLQVVDVVLNDRLNPHQDSPHSILCFRHFDLRAPPLA